MRRNSKLLRRSTFSAQEDVNPMSYMSNLSDAMLVLAVGIMMALVIAWDVDIINTTPEDQSDSQSSSMAQVEELQSEVLDLNITDEKSEDSVSVEDFGLTEYGSLYIDENGNLYVLAP